MPLILPQKNPVNYALCNQTVTVYHQDSDTKQIQRTVYTNAFLDFKKVRNVDKLGSKDVNSFLLVIPCDKQVVFPGDKVYHGIGPTVDNWAKFIPSVVPGLVVIGYVDAKYWHDRIVHVEAGG